MDILFWTCMEHAHWAAFQFFGNWSWLMRSFEWFFDENIPILSKREIFRKKSEISTKVSIDKNPISQHFITSYSDGSPLVSSFIAPKKRCIPSIHVKNSSCAHHFAVKFSPSSLSICSVLRVPQAHTVSPQRCWCVCFSFCHFQCMSVLSLSFSLKSTYYGQIRQPSDYGSI